MTSFFPTINNTDSSGDKIVPNNSPFWGPRIFGVERKEHLKYLDIGQLLVLFFQRGLLKVSNFSFDIYLNKFSRFTDCGRIMMSNLKMRNWILPCLSCSKNQPRLVKKSFFLHFSSLLFLGKKVLGLSSDQNVASYNKSSDRSHRSDKQGCFTISSQGIFKVISSI